MKKDFVIDFFKSPVYKKELLKFSKSLWTDTKKGLAKAQEALKNALDSAWKSEGILNDTLVKVVADNNLKNGDVFWPVRAALSGKEASPSPVELLWVLGREESLKRIKGALTKLK